MSYSILVIEDNVEMAENISAILELARYQVITAGNGKEGVALAQKKLPDLILCDIMMPELDGYGVLHILSKDPETAGIPFIFLTAKTDKQDFRTGMNLGADDYVSKPFDGLDLLKVVEMRLKKSQNMKALNDPVMEGGNQEIVQLKKLIENRPFRTYRKKDLIFMEGQHPNDLFCLERGQVKTYKINSDGKELITGIHGEGDFIGFVPLLEDRPYNENAEVLEEVRVAVIPKSDFLNLVYSNRDVARRFIKMLSGNLEEMENRLLDIAYQSVRNRVASALLKIHERFSPSKQGSIITIARKDFSNIVGTATESLNRTLVDFKNEGLIEISGEGLRIINKPKLERLLR